MTAFGYCIIGLLVGLSLGIAIVRWMDKTGDNHE